jgi:hypothetical protein
MSNILLALVLTLVSGNRLPDEVPFWIPSMRVGGTIRPAPGHRLFIVTATVGEEPIDAEDISRFSLITSAGRREPIGAGVSDSSIVPFDRIPVGQQVGQILPSDAMIVLTRSSATRVALEVDPRVTIAFLYEVPRAASVRALRLPDGRQLAIRGGPE